jgi:uncharacterized protein (TIGR03000 family)
MRFAGPALLAALLWTAAPAEARPVHVAAAVHAGAHIGGWGRGVGAHVGARVNTWGRVGGWGVAHPWRPGFTAHAGVTAHVGGWGWARPGWNRGWAGWRGAGWRGAAWYGRPWYGRGWSGRGWWPGYAGWYGGNYVYAPSTYWYGGVYPDVSPTVINEYEYSPAVVGDTGYYAAPAYGPAAVGDYSGYPASPAYGQPADTAQSPPQDNCAHLLVRVPADAQLWFNGTPVQQRGTDRTFVSPPLTPGQTYHYDVRAQWTENGKPMEVNRTVTVQANEWKEIDLTRPEK